MEAQEYYDEVTSFHRESLQLRRLLHCMTRAATSSTSTSDAEHCQTSKIQLSNRILHQQISDAGSMLSRIKHHGSCISHKYHYNDNDNDMDNTRERSYLSFSVTSAAPTPSPTEYPMDNETLQEINEMMQYLDASYRNASQMIQELLEARGEFIHHDHDNTGNGNVNNGNGNGNNGNNNSNDYNYQGNGIHHPHHPLESTAKLINYLFFDQDDDTASASDTASDIDDEYSDTDTNLDAEQHHQQQTRNNANTTQTPKPKPKLTSTQIQKQQEEILEQEISEMATRLKQSSLGINSTLTAQNLDLYQMEELARDNLDNTKDVTDRVTRQVRAGWRRSLGKWMAFFLVLASWSFCFLTIRVVPKRKGACLFFFCGDDGASESSKDPYINSKHEEYDNQGDSTHTKHKHVDPKYSYCEESTAGNGKKDNQKQCTAPLDPHYHKQNMDRFGNINVNADQIAQMLAEEKRNQRMEMNRHKAESEDERIASMRVRDGWDSRRNGNENYDDDDDDDDHGDNHGGDDDDQNQNQGEDQAEEFDDDDYYHNVGHDDDNDDYYTNNEHREAGNTGVNDLQHDTTVYTFGDLKNAILLSEIGNLEKILEHNPALVRYRDENGWEAIHEAVREGNVDVVRILLDEGGANVDAQVGRTGQGGSTLWLAKVMHDASHPLVVYLVERGALDIGPKRRDEF